MLEPQKNTLLSPKTAFTSETDSGNVLWFMADTSKFSILVVGSGGREHALVQMCLKSPLTERVIATPGNGGMASEVDCYNVGVEDIEGIVHLAQDHHIGLVIVGPEVPLSLGLVDALQAVGIPAYG
ncbi:MAG: phosphoribosylamine--glycine ligase, partial [Lentimonas sp.]